MVRIFEDDGRAVVLDLEGVRALCPSCALAALRRERESLLAGGYVRAAAAVDGAIVRLLREPLGCGRHMVGQQLLAGRDGA